MCKTVLPFSLGPYLLSVCITGKVLECYAPDCISPISPMFPVCDFNSVVIFRVVHISYSKTGYRLEQIYADLFAFLSLYNAPDVQNLVQQTPPNE